MKICLINLPHINKRKKGFGLFPLPQLSILTLGTILKKNNIQVELIDFQLLVANKKIEFNEDFYKKAAKLIDSKKADVLGFTAMCSNYPLALNLAGKCKRSNQKYKIIFGGPQATVTGEETLKSFPFVDIIVYGEGDITLVEVMDKLAKGESLAGVEGISYREGEEVIHNGKRELIKDLDGLPMLDYGLVPPLSEYQGEQKSYTGNIEVGRGCPYNCTYCSTNRHWGRKFRLKSAERIVEEIIYLKKKYRIRSFEFTHDLFTLDKKKLREICELIIRKKLKINWGCHSRADSFDVGDGTLELMAKAGCGGIFYGIESGSKTMQRLMKKNINVDKVEGIIKETIKKGLICSVAFIIGFPEETEEDLNDTLSLALKLASIDCRVRVQMGLLSPAPGTEVMEKHKNDLALTECIPYFTSFSCCLEEEWEMIRKHPDIFSAFYNLRTKHVPLEAFIFAQNWLLVIIRCLPKSLIILCRELKVTMLEAMYLWVKWWKKNDHEITTTADFNVAYDYFYEFAKDIFTERHLSFSFLKDVLGYERDLTLILLNKKKVKRVNRSFVNTIFGSKWEKAMPNVSGNLLIGSFSHDVKRYIEDGARGGSEDKYRTQSRQHYGFYNYRNNYIVKWLSERTRDFLNEINGKRTFGQVIDRFNRKHSVSRGKMLQFLREAVRDGIIEIKMRNPKRVNCNLLKG